MTLSVTNSFSAGTAIVASQMNANFTDITTWANGAPTIGASGSTVTVGGALLVVQGVTINGATPIVLEGATGNAHETSIAVTDPTADRTITLPDASGTVSLTDGISFSGSTANGVLTYHDASTATVESTATYDGTTLQLTTSGGGLKMDGLNSSNANTLDDYEEGTFDVTATVASGTLTVDTNRDTLKYTKIGNRVFIMGQIEFTTASTPSGAWSLSGLPFTNTNTGTYSVNKRPNIATGISTPASDIDPGSPFGWIEANTTVITMAVGGIASTATLNANHIDTGTHVFITGQYVCDS